MRRLARQLSPANEHKLAAELLAMRAAAEVHEVYAISGLVRTDNAARGLPPITDEDLDRELREFRQERRAA